MGCLKCGECRLIVVCFAYFIGTVAPIFNIGTAGAQDFRKVWQPFNHAAAERDVLAKHVQLSAAEKEVRTINRQLQVLKKRVDGFDTDDIELAKKVLEAEKEFNRLGEALEEASQREANLKKEINQIYNLLRRHGRPNTPQPYRSPLLDELFPKKWTFPGSGPPEGLVERYLE